MGYDSWLNSDKDYSDYCGIETEIEREFRMVREDQEERAVDRLIKRFRMQNNHRSADHFEMKVSEASD